MDRLVNFEQQTSDLLNEQQAAAILDIKIGTLQVWRTTGRYKLPFIKIGRNVRYKREDLEAWIVSRQRTSGATV